MASIPPDYPALERKVGELMASISPDYPALGKRVGERVAKKQLAYGDSFGRSAEVFRVLFPTGIPPERYQEALAIAPIVDQLFRLATAPEALAESPGLDIAGYGLLIAARHGAAPGAARPAFEPAEPDPAAPPAQADPAAPPAEPEPVSSERMKASVAAPRAPGIDVWRGVDMGSPVKLGGKDSPDVIHPRPFVRPEPARVVKLD